MEATQYLAILRRWWWLLLVATVAGGFIAYAATGLITPTYQASTTLRVHQQQTPGVIVQADIQTSRLLADSYSRLVTVPSVLTATIDQGGFNMSPAQLRASIDVDNPGGTELLEISATSDDPVLARDIANIVAEIFISSDPVQAGSESGSVTIIQPASTPFKPIAPQPTLNAVLGAMLALVAMSMLVLLFEYLDDTVKTAEHVQDLVGLSTLGYVAGFGTTRTPAEQLQVAIDPSSTLAEDFRTIRMTLTHTLALRRTGGGEEARKLVVFSSPNRGEGTSTTVANLAVVFGDAGYRVAVVDADLREPTQHEIFAAEPGEGFTDVLVATEGSAMDSLQATSHPNVSLLPSGPIPGNPSEWLGSARATAVLGELREQFDIVMLDSSPALLTDPSVLAASADAIVLIAEPNKTRSGELRTAVQGLSTSGSPVVGVILNRVRPGARRQVTTNFRQLTDVPGPTAPLPFREGTRRARQEPAVDR